MTPLAWMAFVCAAAAGASLRHLIHTAVGHHGRDVFPWGTLVVNIAGSLLAGFVAGLGLYHGLSGPVVTVLAVGFCGAFTTFSTFSFETIQLIEQGAARVAVRNVAATLIVGVAAAAAGLGLAGLI